MLQLKVTRRQTASDDDELGRREVGWEPEDSPQVIYDNARGVWDLDPGRAMRDGLAVVVHAGRVVGGFTIEHAERVAPRRTVLSGTPLEANDPRLADFAPTNVRGTRQYV